MSLAARRSTRLREDFVIRLGCFLVSFAVLASLVLEPPRAKAFALTSSAVTALAGGFLNACGLAPVVSGMSSSGEVNESLARLLQDFLNEEVGGISVADWALSFGEIGLAVKDKKIVIPKPFAEKLGQFAQWIAGKYGTKPGLNAVFSDQSITFPDGTVVMLTEIGEKMSSGIYSFGAIGTSIPYGTFESPYIIEMANDVVLKFYLQGSQLYARGQETMIFDLSSFERNGVDTSLTLYVCPRGIGYDDRAGVLAVGLVYYSDKYKRNVISINPTFPLLEADMVESLLSGIGLSLDISDTMQQILDRLTALEEGQSIALDVGATQSMEIQEILQGILDAILAGDFAASAEIVDEAVEPVDPPAGELPDVDGLGLPALGAALTSRFPFSIPWDVYKGVTLLAAPPKAPYFEVDFMAPIADRVGGWQGSTTIVLDFSEYEIIGQVCRWTSTIGFCLMLATGTKRLIWTA